MASLVGKKAEFAETGWTQPRALVAGLSYSFDRHVSRDKTSVYKCTKRTSNCRARLWLDGRRLVVAVAGEHCCRQIPDKGLCKAQLLAAAARKEAKEQPTKAVADILGAHSASEPHSVLKKCLKKASLQRSLRRARLQQCQLPPAPKDLTFQVPVTLCKADLGGEEPENILIWASGPVAGDWGDRVLIWSFQQGLDLLAKSGIVFGDGTFSSTPKHFYQTFVLSARFVYDGGERAVPCVWALLSGKKQGLYELVFRKVAEAAGLQWSTKRLICDFELGIGKAFVKVGKREGEAAEEEEEDLGQEEEAEDDSEELLGGGEPLHFCFFHFRQSVHRRRKDLVPDAVFRPREDLQLFYKMLVGLAFLPKDDIAGATKALVWGKD
jgi:hypothetical protein